MNDVAVSVILPVYNRAGMIGAAIDSVVAAAAALPIEIIAVDDASTDDTWQVLRAMPDVRAIRLERNSGQSAARNHGLALARGRFVKYLDSDDFLLPDHFTREVRALEDEGADIAVSGWCEEDNGVRQCFDAPPFDSIVDDVLAGRAVPTSAALYRRRDEWRWDPSLRKLDDWDYFCQAALGATRIVSVPGPAYVMRHHDWGRVTNVSLFANAREHHHILQKIETRLAREGRLTDARRKRLAQYYYRELRVLSLNDREAFERAVAHMLELDPRFQPRDEEPLLYMRLLARLLGVRNAVRLHSAVKSALKPQR
ncbi:MAG TPA: glycosyltransferase family 2 protein [Thermoanaerobaculia bacterium]